MWGNGAFVFRVFHNHFFFLKNLNITQVIINDITQNPKYEYFNLIPGST